MQVRSQAVLALFSLCTAILLAGCGLQTAGIVEKDVPSPAMSGTVFGGQQPVVGAVVSVYQMGTSGYGTGASALASTTTDSNGNFAFNSSAYTCPYSNTPVYLLATGGNPGGGANGSLALAAALGSCSTAKTTTVNINEVTTAVTAFALSHFFTTTLGGNPGTDLFGGTAAGSGVYNVGLVAANSYTVPHLVTLATGNVVASTSTMTVESAKIYSIADSLAACVNSTGATSTTETTTNCGKLFSYTTPSGLTRPADTLQAAVRMALYPYLNVSSIYNLGGTTPPFPGLATAPNDWTIGVSYTSPTFALAINGSSTSRTSSTIDIDAAGNVWFPTNGAAASGVAYFSPFSQTFNGPYITGLTHPQYVAVTTQGNVFADDLFGAHIGSTSTTSPTAAGTLVATTGYTGPIVAGYSGTTPDTIFFTGGGTPYAPGSTAYTDNNGTLAALVTYIQPPNGLANYTFSAGSKNDLDAGVSGSSTVCTYEYYPDSGPTAKSSTAASPCYVGGIANTTDELDVAMTTSTNQLCEFYSCFTAPVSLSTPEAIETDGGGQLWIANSGNASISTLKYAYSSGNASDFSATSTVPYLHDSTHGNTMSAPYGLAIDRSGNVWVSNASCVTTSSTACTPVGFTLSELVGAAYPTVTPLAAQIITKGEGTPPAQIVVGGSAAQSQSSSVPSGRHVR